MKNPIASTFLLNPFLLATMASLPWISTANAQAVPGAFSKLNVGDNTGSASGDGTLVAEGKHNVSPLLGATFQTAGSRMLWYPRNSAFRVGAGDVTHWNGSTMGAYSFAAGSRNIASGSSSGALGYYNTTSSYATSSVALGSYNTATGWSSMAFGSSNTSIGSCSTALGNDTISSAYGETVIGTRNEVISTSGNPWDWNPSHPVFQIGNGHWDLYEVDLDIDLNGNGHIDQTGSEYIPAKRSNALTVFKNGDMELQGDLTVGGKILGDIVANSISVPHSSLNIAGVQLSNGSLSGAGDITFSGNADIAGGSGNATQSVGMSQSYADANWSTAMSGSLAWGEYSTAMAGGMTGGYFSTAASTGYAEGEYSFSAGPGTYARAKSSVALGSNNQYWGSNGSWIESDPILLVGNGENSQSNAITVLKNGQTTLINKAWKANPSAPLADPAPPTDSEGKALVVDGHTVLNGKVIISVPQGDISMGIYQ